MVGLLTAGVDRRPKPTAVAEGFAPTATATAAEGFWPNFGRRSEKIGISFITVWERPFESFSSVHKNNNKNSMAFLEGMLLDSINVVESSFLASLYNQLYDESLSIKKSILCNMICNAKHYFKCSQLKCYGLNLLKYLNWIHNIHAF